MRNNSITLESTDGVARVTLNRPERRNALSMTLLQELQRALNTAATDPAVAVIVIAGAGRVFSAGHDLQEMIGREESFYRELFTECTVVMQTIQRVPQPVIARVHGVATAAGCQLVAACDLAVATDDCRFATPGVRIGLFCSVPMVPITRAIGRKRALEMLLTGEPISAATARDWGLVNRVVPPAELDDCVAELVGQITRFSKDVIGIGKAAFYRQIDEPQDQAYEITASIMSSNATHGDAQEGMTAFLEKRPPQWNRQ